jgi:hypothetical protein
VHLDDRGFLPAIGSNAHGVVDLESAGAGPGLRIHRSSGCRTVIADARAPCREKGVG